MNYKFLMNSSKLFKDFLRCKSICIPSGRLSSKKNYRTVKELKKELSELLGVDHGFQPDPPDRSKLLKYVPKFEDLPPRNIKDSFLEGIIPLSTDANLQEKYITFLGRVRIGRLLEDMDIFAVHVGYKHIYAPTIPADAPSPYILVTAHCDQLDYTTFQRKHNEDIKLSGFVSWVGKSSMEIVVWLEQHYRGSWHKITRALFLLAARNPTAKQALAVNPMKPSNDFEKKILQDGEARKVRRSNNSQRDLSKVIPTTEEQQIIHELYLRTKSIGDKATFRHGIVAMQECRTSNIIFCQPEDRNFYNTIFGGFIMRHATEIAWVLGYQFFRQRPYIHHVSDIEFHSPIAVNALIHMNARVVYTQDKFAQIFVVVTALDPIEGKATRSNTFHFTLKSPKEVKQVYPISYHEAMLYVDGKRHFVSMMEKNSANLMDVMDEYMQQLSRRKF